MFELIISYVFGISLFLNAALFVPQAYRIYREKNSKNLSLITFFGFCFIQTSSIAYGYIKQDNILFYGYIISLLSCGVVVCLIFKYRDGNKS